MSAIAPRRLGAAVLWAFALGSCLTDPVTGSRSFSLVDPSPEQERELGALAAPGIEAQFDAAYPDAELQAQLEACVLELVELSPRRDDFEFQFLVLDSSIPNALALPGGRVYITRGLLARLANQGEFVAVLGHELGHVEHKHAARNLSRSALLRLPTAPLDLIGAVLPVGGRAVGAVSSIVRAPGAVVNLSYSRSQEYQADLRGVHYARALGFDPRAMIGVLEKLESYANSVEDSGPSAPTLLRTHPLESRRIEHIEECIAELDFDGDTPLELRADDAAFARVLQRFRDEAPAYALVDSAGAQIERAQVADTLDEALVTSAVSQLEAARKALPGEPLVLQRLGEAALLVGDADASVAFFEGAETLFNARMPGSGHWKTALYLGLIALARDESGRAVEWLELAAARFPRQPLIEEQLAQARTQQAASTTESN